MIKAEKLSFGFSSHYLFENISFSLEENCHCALIGSNGTGKTTLMNLIREPDHYTFSGKLKLDGTGRIGYVSQFAIREGDQSVTVYDYLCQDFLRLEEAINEALHCGHGYVIDCAIEMDEMVRPMVPGGSHITNFLVD